MSIDLSQFHGVFLEESQEHLNDMEHLLMSLDISNPDLEDLNSIFRAAHSIKGGSGIFGFDALISVTHVMENLFDKARQQEFTFCTQVVDDLLSAIDVLRTLLSSYRNKSEPDWNLVEVTSKNIEHHLTQEAITDDAGFGLFNPTETLEEQEQEQGYGIFKSEPVQSCDDGFGFFDDSSQEKTIEPSFSAIKPMVDNNEGFGFFDEVDKSAAADRSSASGQKTIQQQVTPNKKETEAVNVVSPKSSTKSSTAASPRSDNSESSSIRVDIGKVDTLVNLAGELVITQSMLNLLGAEVEGAVAERLQTALMELERNTRELQESIMSIRMLPMSFVFNRFPRVVRDLSSKLKKEIELVIEGGQTEIDKGLIERLVDPLTHLVRNSLDHGIEVPSVRAERGKNVVGRLILRAEQKGGNILISVVDDGGGLNREKILAKAEEKGIMLSDNPTDTEVWQLIMAPGFSTAAEVTDVSGRGVGMDVVKRNIESMGGRIDIQSETGVGSTFQIRLPLTLAILDGMSVAVADQLFIVPLVTIIESVQPEKEQLKNIGNQQMLELRDAYWPIVKLHEIMSIEGAHQASEQAILVLIETSKTRFALQVDDLIGQQQVVIKSLEQHYRRVAGIAGATIMGDGSVALILDVESLATHASEVTGIKDQV